jgi:hypothetical protein
VSIYKKYTTIFRDLEVKRTLTSVASAVRAKVVVDHDGWIVARNRRSKLSPTMFQNDSSVGFQEIFPDSVRRYKRITGFKLLAIGQGGFLDSSGYPNKAGKDGNEKKSALVFHDLMM